MYYIGRGAILSLKILLISAFIPLSTLHSLSFFLVFNIETFELNYICRYTEKNKKKLRRNKLKKKRKITAKRFDTLNATFSSYGRYLVRLTRVCTQLAITLDNSLNFYFTNACCVYYGILIKYWLKTAAFIA